MTMQAIYPDLKGKSVFITGGGSGIGAALTEGFLCQGAKVAFCQRSDASDFVAEMEEKTGNKPLFLPCDLTDVTALKNTLAAAKQAHGSIQVLVNNAANDKRHLTSAVDEDFFDWNVAINLKSYFFACQTVLPDMQAAKAGSIINFSSISYMMGNAGYPLYTMANSGINGLTRSLAREFGPDGIRVNALAPGWVLTQKQKDMWVTEDGLAAHLERQCTDEPLAPEQMVGPVLYLASDAASATTGQAIVADGGVVVTG